MNQRRLCEHKLLCHFSKVYIKFLASICSVSGKKKAVLVLSKGWGEIGNISLKCHSQILEKTGRIQDPAGLQVNSKTSKPVTAPDSNIHKMCG